MFESYRRIKLFLSKKEGDFIHDLEQSFFALVNASRDPNVPFFSSSEYSIFSYLSNSVLLASPFAGMLRLLKELWFKNSLPAYGAYVRPMPYSNEVGLRMLIGGATREDTFLGYHITPLFSYYGYHRPVFRVLLRLNRGKIHDSRHYAILVTATNVEILMNILGINLVRLVALASGNTEIQSSSLEGPFLGYESEATFTFDFFTLVLEFASNVLCAGSGLYVDSILESQGIIVKVRCLDFIFFVNLIILLCKPIAEHAENGLKFTIVRPYN
ncbi:hypothetical protein Ahy_B04g069845 [Arachis hypogaea]|uniref:Uncharacterized protein n=1 Tax=Arachis hypogaea TaxID=3818 RepID=A0A444ZDP8_ARAHY|nr:hypothetical protein Ahy_B04g069845 [Arachis hypogaea]